MSQRRPAVLLVTTGVMMLAALVMSTFGVLGPTVGDYHDEPAEAAFFLAAMDQVRLCISPLNSHRDNVA
jgi:hypothetical protein